MKKDRELITAALEISEALIKVKPLESKIRDIVEGIEKILEADWVALIRLDTDRQEFKDIFLSSSRWNLSVPDSYGEFMEGLTGWVITHGEPVLSNEMENDPRESEEVRRRRIENGLGSIMVTPVDIERGIVGTLTAIRGYDREEFCEEDLHLLRTLSHQAAAAIENSRLYESLNRELEQRGKAEKGLREKRDELEKALQEKEMLLREVHHRVKNNLALIESIIELQSQEAENRLEGEAAHTTLDILKDLQSRIDSIRLVHEKLYSGTAVTEVRVDEYLSELADMIIRSMGETDKRIHTDYRLEPEVLSAKSAVSLGLLVGELVTNSVKYAFSGIPEPRIAISFTREHDKYLLTVSDNGTGMDAELLEQRGESLGLKLVQALAKQLSGSAELADEHGTVWRVRFPVEA